MLYHLTASSVLIFLAAGSTEGNASSQLYACDPIHSQEPNFSCPVDHFSKQASNKWAGNSSGPPGEPLSSFVSQSRAHSGEIWVESLSPPTCIDGQQPYRAFLQADHSASTTAGLWGLGTVSRSLGGHIRYQAPVMSSVESSGTWTSHGEIEGNRHTASSSTTGHSLWQPGQSDMPVSSEVPVHHGIKSSTSDSFQLKAPRKSPSNMEASSSKTRKSKRTPHNLVERRYRRNLQDRIDQLASKVPGWEINSPRKHDIENAELAINRRSKASAIAAAAKHIDNLERDIAMKDEFVKALQEQIQGLQRLVRRDDCSILRCLQENVGGTPSVSS